MPLRRRLPTAPPEVLRHGDGPPGLVTVPGLGLSVEGWRGADILLAAGTGLDTAVVALPAHGLPAARGDRLDPGTSAERLIARLDDLGAGRVALVGHTDAQGSLDANIALSKRRAQAVADRLVAGHGVARAQLQAEGMGWLAPVATNLTPEGREANRRVEAVVLP